jgi:hypothetical protein
LNSLWGISPKNLSKKSSPQKYLSKGVLNGPPRPLLTVFVVLIFTTAGFNLSAKSANEKGARGLSGDETADTVGTLDPTGTKDDLNTSIREMIKKPIRKASRNMIKVFLFLFSISYLLTSLGLERFELKYPCAISINIYKIPLFFIYGRSGKNSGSQAQLSGYPS